jgi:hypothetical protein
MLHSASDNLLPAIPPITRRDSALLAVDDDHGHTDRVPEIEDPAGEDLPRHLNSVDATAGQPIVTRVMARQRELEAALAALPDDETRERGDLALALSTVEELLTGDLAHVPPVVARSMSRWLEGSKHLAENAVVSVIDPVTAPFEIPTPTP